MPTSEYQQARLTGLQDWGADSLRSLGHEIGADFRIASASDDASFRRYYRGYSAGASYIFVDAPPDKEDNQSFVDIEKRLSGAGVLVPQVLAADLDLGYLLLIDLGDQLLLPQLQSAALDGQEKLYHGALEVLVLVSSAETKGLPVYDADRLQTEMSLFPDWFLAAQLQLSLPKTALDQIQSVSDLMIENALRQPSVFVHRDFHSRNLMPQEDGSLGVIDFQDGVLGPITYDLVSLLKDCYWRLPRASVLEIVEAYRLRVSPGVGKAEFLRWFDLMGFQRHLKCAGIFSRLNLRDGKPRYLEDIPLVVSYLTEVAAEYADLNDFGTWLETEIVPSLNRLGP
ncbi:MAG: aminoglycoside/choline kinase family phosphotransferase [Candidatus Azotimanducaceae bacterium]|jgi:aminoglycoside/choline kinase family phosphotransferase